MCARKVISIRVYTMSAGGVGDIAVYGQGARAHPGADTRVRVPRGNGIAALQSMAGNRAVTRLLSAQRSGLGPTGTPVVQRHENYRVKTALETPLLATPDLQAAHSQASLALEVGRSSGDPVGRLQQGLTTAGFTTAVTGTFDAGTQQAAAGFQAEHGIPYPTGRQAGPKTLSALDDHLIGAGPGPTPPGPTPPGPNPPGPTPPGPNPVPPAPSCPLPRVLGMNVANCGNGADFAHFDAATNPPSSTAAMQLGAFALSLPPHKADRRAVSNATYEATMDNRLSSFGGAAGHDAFTRFVAGTGGTVIHDASSQLGQLAIKSATFDKAVKAVKAELEQQLAAQVSKGAFDECALSIANPPRPDFGVTDGLPLKTVIGGTQGATVLLENFHGDPHTRTYTADLRFLLCDDFGVDESDIYVVSLAAFWVLQHERSATAYAPFINALDLPTKINGSV